MREQSNQDFIRGQEFTALRSSVLKETAMALRQRLETNPVPTEAELQVGAFAEELEPQVRDAIFEFYRKGYDTRGSGFWGKNGDLQVIDGLFVMNEADKAKLKELGVDVTEQPQPANPKWTITQVSFKPEIADIQQIKQKWDQVASVIQGTGQPIRNPGVIAAAFRYEFTPEEGEKDLQRIAEYINSSDYPEDRRPNALKFIQDIRDGKFKKLKKPST